MLNNQNRANLNHYLLLIGLGTLLGLTTIGCDSALVANKSPIDAAVVPKTLTLAEAYGSLAALSTSQRQTLDARINQLTFPELYRLMAGAVTDANVVVGTVPRGGSLGRLHADQVALFALGDRYATLGDWAASGAFPRETPDFATLQHSFALLEGTNLNTASLTATLGLTTTVTPISPKPGDAATANCDTLHTMYESALGVTRADIAAAMLRASHLDGESSHRLSPEAAPACSGAGI